MSFKNSVFLPNPWQLLCPGRLLRSATSISRRETETSMVFYMVTCRVIPLTWKSLSAFRRIRCWTGSMTAETELTKRLSKIEVTLDLKQILKPCNDLRTHRRGHGFKCSEVNLYRNCLQMASWCAHFPIYTCSELYGTTATEKHTSYLSWTPRIYSCKFFLASVNFYRFNAKNWQFTVYFAVITQKIGNFLCILS